MMNRIYTEQFESYTERLVFIMFFIFGIANGEKKIEFVQTMVCSRCGQFGRLEAFMTYMYFSLFFIPILRWNKRYYIKSSCCNTVYEIDRELGKRIHKGEPVNLTEADLHIVNQRTYYSQQSCPNCGYPTSNEYEYCPKCGRKL
jgi:hypothetical protein